MGGHGAGRGGRLEVDESGSLGCLGWVLSRFPAPASLFKIRAENIARSFLLLPQASQPRTKVSPRHCR